MRLVKNVLFLGVFLLLVLISCSAEESKTLGDPFAGSVLLESTHKTRINEWIGKASQTWKLLYRRSEHGASSAEFHARSDGQGPTVILVKMDNGVLIGGYASGSWDSSSGYVGNADSFLFSLTNDFKHLSTGSEYHFYANISYGPTFGGGHDLYIGSNMTTGYCHIGYSYITRVGTLGSAEARNDFCGSYDSWNIEELEVWGKKS